MVPTAAATTTTLGYITNPNHPIQSSPTHPIYAKHVLYKFTLG